MMSAFYITVKKGLLDSKHIQNMRVSQKTSAIWLYLWFLDKVTRIEKNRLGVVLGGKPIKLEEIDLGLELKTIRKMFHCLLKHEYIKVARTPYGHKIYITKAFKIFGQKVIKKSGRSEAEKSKRGRSLYQNAVGLIKTRQLDNINTITKVIGDEPQEIKKDDKLDDRLKEGWQYYALEISKLLNLDQKDRARIFGFAKTCNDPYWLMKKAEELKKTNVIFNNLLPDIQVNYLITVFRRSL